MHVRNRQKAQSKFWFIFDCKTVPYCSSYKYLGITIDQYLDFKSTTQVQCDTLKCKQNNELKLECLEMPKLRTFNLFKDFKNVPSYLSKSLNYFQRRALASLRIGSFRIRIETQRYLHPKIPYEQRFCVTCPNHIECEIYYLFSCTAYSNLRNSWLSSLEKPENFDTLDNGEKLDIVLNINSNIKLTANFILNAFDICSKILAT